jgi:hypothetical protein
MILIKRELSVKELVDHKGSRGQGFEGSSERLDNKGSRGQGFEGSSERRKEDHIR